MLIRSDSTRRFPRDSAGAVTMMTVIFFIGIALILGLAVDAGRAYSERARLQAWVDSLAVAVAAELDGRADAIQRADWLIANAGLSQRGLWSATAGQGRGGAAPDGGTGEYGGGAGNGFGVGRVRYLSRPPEGGLAALAPGELASLVTTDPTQARAVLIESAMRDVRWTALDLLDSSEARSSFAVGARAVAVPMPTLRCGAPILAVCAPQDDMADLTRAGVQLRLDKNLDGLWEPGEYGVITDILDDAAGTCAEFDAAEKLTCLMAINAPQSQCPARIDIRAGDGVDVSGALNTRFDIWADSISHLDGSPAISSDLNTISGALYACNGAQYDVVSDSMGLPDDPCFHNGACDWASEPVQWRELDLYWEANHGDLLPGGLSTRYQVYLHEILRGFLDPEGPEDSRDNTCNPNAAPRRDRRLLDVALIDCDDIEGIAQAGAPVAGHAQALLTAPADHTASFIATFDGVHQNEWMRSGDIVRQAWAGDVESTGGNPGNHKDVGAAGETPNGQGGWGGGARGRSDGDRQDFEATFRLDRDADGVGSDNGDFSAFNLGEAQLGGQASIVLEVHRDGGEYARIDRIVLDRNGNNDIVIEAEDMAMDAYESRWGSSASGNGLAKLHDDEGVLSAEFEADPKTYDVIVHAQDESDGQSEVELRILHGDGDEPGPAWPSGDLRVRDDRGRITYDPYRDTGLVRIDVKRSVSAQGSRDPWENVPMLFDTAYPTGGDEDLASTRFGNVLIISEDGDAGDPDDEAKGGWLLFHFDRPTRVDALTVFDTEKGGVIRLYDHFQPDPTGEFRTRRDGALDDVGNSEEHDPREMAHLAVPRLGDGKHVKMRIGREGVRTLAYFIPDSGGVDNLEYFNELTEPLTDDRIMLEIVRMAGSSAGNRSALYD